LSARHLGIGLDDMFQYDMLARSLALGNGFRWYAPADLARLAPYLHLDVASLALDPRGMLTTFRAPVYPSFLAVVYLVNGINDDRFFAARLAQMAIGALLAPLTYLTARHVLPENERAGRIAAWTVAVYPMLLIFPLALATENLFFLLVLVGVLALLKLAEHSRETSQANYLPTIYYSVLSGFLLGLSALTRSVILPFAGLALLWIWFSLKARRDAVLAGLTLLVTVLPWIVRNSLLNGRITGIETSMGYNLYVGYHPQSTGTFTFGPSLDLLSILDDRVRDETGTRQAIQFIRQDPARFPYLAVRRLGYFFNLELRAFTYFYVNDFLGPIPAWLLTIILLLLATPFVVISLSAILGAASLAPRPPTALLFLLFIGYLLPHVFILSEERFHLTLIPFFAICAANFWTRGISAFKSLGRFALTVSSFFALCLAANWAFELVRDWHVLAAMLGSNGNQLYLPY
jgi:hypothetical protein